MMHTYISLSYVTHYYFVVMRAVRGLSAVLVACYIWDVVWWLLQAMAWSQDACTLECYSNPELSKFLTAPVKDGLYLNVWHTQCLLLKNKSCYTIFSSMWPCTAPICDKKLRTIARCVTSGSLVWPESWPSHVTINTPNASPTSEHRISQCQIIPNYKCQVCWPHRNVNKPLVLTNWGQAIMHTSSSCPY